MRARPSPRRRHRARDPRRGLVEPDAAVDGFAGLYGYYDGFTLYADAYYGGDTALQAANQAIERAGNAGGPALLVHGDADEVVPVDQSLRFADALTAASVPVQLHVAEGMGHCFDHTPLGLTAEGVATSRLVLDWLSREF